MLRNYTLFSMRLSRPRDWRHSSPFLFEVQSSLDLLLAVSAPCLPYAFLGEELDPASFPIS